jgi:hypothetical protein
MPSSVEQQALADLTTALGYAQSAQAIAHALAAVPGVSTEAVAELLRLGPVRSMLRLQPAPGASQAIQAMHRQNLMRRAAYLVNAARRLTGSIRRGQLRSGLVDERRWLEQHLQATAKRVQAADAVAKEVKRQLDPRDGSAALGEGPVLPSGLLGWYAKMDARTSPECRQAHGRNFDPTRIPLIGFPGAVHPHCRCKPGPPWAAALRAEEVRPEDARVALDTSQFNTEVAASRVSGGWMISGGIV